MKLPGCEATHRSLKVQCGYRLISLQLESMKYCGPYGCAQGVTTHFGGVRRAFYWRGWRVWKNFGVMEETVLLAKRATRAEAQTDSNLVIKGLE